MTFAEASEVDAAVVAAAYRSKYGRSNHVEAMTAAAAASTTLQLVPR